VSAKNSVNACPDRTCLGDVSFVVMFFRCNLYFSVVKGEDIPVRMSCHINDTLFTFYGELPHKVPTVEVVLPAMPYLGREYNGQMLILFYWGLFSEGYFHTLSVNIN